MVNFNLIHSLGNLDEEADLMVADALGAEAAQDPTKLVANDEVQDFVPGTPGFSGRQACVGP